MSKLDKIEKQRRPRLNIELGPSLFFRIAFDIVSTVREDCFRGSCPHELFSHQLDMTIDHAVRGDTNRGNRKHNSVREDAVREDTDHGSRNSY